MKRSCSLSLVLLGSLMFGAQGCSESKQEDSFNAFTSIEDCSSSGFFSPEECRGFAGEAINQNPRFSSLSECEKNFGQGECTSLKTLDNTVDASNGTAVEERSRSMWMPMMAGFMAGRMISGGGYSQASQPLYRDSKQTTGARTFRTGGGEIIKPEAGGKVANPSPKLKQALQHKAKPVMGRSSVKSTGGFSGGSRFGGAGS